jgi:hypothetical protein
MGDPGKRLLERVLKFFLMAKVAACDESGFQWHKRLNLAGKKYWIYYQTIIWLVFQKKNFFFAKSSDYDGGFTFDKKDRILARLSQ